MEDRPESRPIITTTSHTDNPAHQERFAFGPTSSADRLLAVKHVAADGGIRIMPEPSVRGGSRPRSWALSWCDDDLYRMFHPERDGIRLWHERPRRRGPARTAAPQPVEDSVCGLLVIPIPTPRGELTSLVTAYGNHLGDAGGERLLWRTLDDPRLHDALYARQRTPAMARGDRASVREYLELGREQYLKDHYITAEYLALMQELGLPSQVAPLIVFAALDPVDMLAVLPLDVGMFTDCVREKALADHLLTDLSQEKILEFAAAGQFTPDSMQRLQQYLAEMGPKLRMSTGLAQPIGGDRDSGAIASATEAADGQAYATVMGFDQERRLLTKAAYCDIVKDLSGYDYVIDGVTRECHRRRQVGAPMRTQTLTPGQFCMIRGFIVTEGVHSPREFYVGKSTSFRTIMRQFDSARQMVEQPDTAGQFVLFKMHKRPTAAERSFEFSPPSEVRWLFLDLHVG